MSPNGFTPTQKAILEVLSDGLPHLRQELIDCLGDPLATNLHLNDTLSKLRRKLRPHGHDVVCTLAQRRISYRHVRTLHSPNE